MPQPPRTNGRAPQAPSDEAQRLVTANYADRAAAALPDTRYFTNEFIRRLLGEYDPNNVSIRDMRLMRSDYTIKMALHYGKAPLVSADYTFICDDPQIAAGTKEAYDAVHVPLTKIALTSQDFGYQGAIKQYEFGQFDGTYEDQQSGKVKQIWTDDAVRPVVLGVPIPLPPELTEPELVKGKFSGIRTALANLNSADQNTQNNDLVPVDWALWFANEFEEEFRNYRGKSRLVPAYRPWYSYWYNYHGRDRHAEQDADPPLQIWYPPGVSRVKQADGSYVTVSNRDEALKIGRELRNGATIAWPSDVYMTEDGRISQVQKWKAEFLQGGQNIEAFNSLLSDLEVAKLRACLVPEQILIEAQRGTGARNVAATQVDVFMQSLEFTSVYIDLILNKYFLRPFIEANWGKDAPPCVKRTTGFKQEDLTLVTTLIEAAFTADPNALPINFEKLLEKAGVDMYSKMEQEERDRAIQEAQQAQAEAQQQAQAVGQLPGEAQPQLPPGPQVGALPGEQPQPDPQALAASQDHLRTGPRKYETEVIHLSGHKIKQAPEWARREGRRRDNNVNAIGERIRDVVQARYEDMFEAAAQAVADFDNTDLSATVDAYMQDEIDSLDLALGDTLNTMVASLVTRIKQAIVNKIAGYRGPVEDELASAYHAAGGAELLRLGLDTESWDIGRDEVQEWARERAGELISTMDSTVVEQHIRPWLASVLQTEQAGAADFAQGLPVDSVELAAQLTDKFSSYPQWMAERVVRSEARMGYNQSAADMWERVGIEDVVEFDGLGGKTGQTDDHCLRRNGQTVTLDQFRQDDRDEHPNGSLGAIPVTEGVRLRPLEDSGVIYASAEVRRSPSIYAVREDGWILSEAEVGKLLI